MHMCDEPSHHPPLCKKPALRLALLYVCLIPLCRRPDRRSPLFLASTVLSSRPACEAVLGGLGGLGGSPEVCRKST
jgi:hypothetical protein